MRINAEYEVDDGNNKYYIETTLRDGHTFSSISRNDSHIRLFFSEEDDVLPDVGNIRFHMARLDRHLERHKDDN